MLYWPDRPRTDELSFKNFNLVGFTKPSASGTLWGSDGIGP